MCGIAGYIDFQKRTSSKILEEMIDYLHHRGPDDKGTYHFENSEMLIALGQARLSVLDLSPAGHQPMVYNNIILIFNGEIYNFREIREALIKLSHIFVSNSDSEVILHAYEQWGTKFVEKLIGMFAIVIFDKKKNKCYLFRDRVGVKPLYYYYQEGLIIFASELKAFHVHPSFNNVINTGVLALYFKYGYIPSPYCIFENTIKIEPGNYVEIDLTERKISQHEYWNVTTYYRKPKLKLSYIEALDQIHKLLISSCNYRMIADVPVGIFLSGGYDSSAVTAILQRGRSETLKTFTIGFEKWNNEAPYALKIAKYLGTDHTEYICTTKEAQDIIPLLPYFFDEPFADSSAIPTVLVSRIAREKVTVALSADGGDEVFAGYTDYLNLYSHLNKYNYIPGILKGKASHLIACMADLLPSRGINTKYKLKSFATNMSADSFTQTTQLFKLSKSLPDYYLRNILAFEPVTLSTKFDLPYSDFINELEIPLAIDYQMYLQSDILEKVDRATMSISLEGREPLLDHRLIEFAAQLPLEYKINKSNGKRILKDIVHNYIPRELVERPKVGFSLPIYSWLRGELKYLIDDFLCTRALNDSGLFNASFIRLLIEQFENNNLHYSPLIWRLLMFQMWYFKWVNGPGLIQK